MNDFEFYNPCRIIFGRKSETKLLYEIRKAASSVLLVYGGGSIKRNGLYEIVADQLREAGVAWQELSGVSPNPKLSLVKKGIELCKRYKVDFILAVGGGSVIDTAKAIAVGALSEQDVWDLYLADSKPHRALPVGVVLTIAAAGSESSPNSVITDDLTGLKRSIKSECIIPRFAIMNPERTTSLPPYQTACGCSDIIAHLLERYISTTKNVEYTDELIEATIRRMLVLSPIALKKPFDYDVRAEIMWCGTMAHNNVLSVGRDTDWASHNIEHELSGLNDVAHGAGLAIIFPAYIKFVYKKDINRFYNLATRVFGVEEKEKEAAVLEMIDKMEAFYKSLGLPTRLSEINITAKDIPLLSQKCLYGRTSVGGFCKLTEKEVAEVLKLCL